MRGFATTNGIGAIQFSSLAGSCCVHGGEGEFDVIDRFLDPGHFLCDSLAC